MADEEKRSRFAKLSEPSPDGSAPKRRMNYRVKTGIAAIAAGVALSVATYAYAANAGGGRYYLFSGLVLIGIIQIVRGLSNSST